MAVPLDQVINLRQQGFSNDQIIQSLQRDGFNAQDIYTAMSQADIKGSMGGGQAPQTPPQGPPPPNMQMPSMPPSQPGEDTGSGGASKERVEELVEAVIDEKWEDFVKRFDKIAEWKESAEAKINQMEQKLNDLSQNFNTLHENILGKVGEYDENLSNVSNEIKALEKVFQKIIPTLTENVNELSRITEKMKK